MPVYLFRCEVCGELSRERLAVDQRHNAPDCPNCALLMQREFSVPQLNTRPFYLLEENTPYPGLSGTEVVAEMKREDAEYEKVDYSHLPKKRTPKQIFADNKPMAQIFNELGD